MTLARLAPFLLLLPAAASAQPEIVVTGRGLAEGLGDAVYDEVELDRDALTGSASGRLDEILKQVPGLQLFRRSDARSANPTSQGVTLRALGGNASSRALLLLDGVPQADPFGGWISWPAYDPELLASVRVVRGGGSGVHGPGALAGTIEMESAGPAELRGLSGSVERGSRNSLDLRAAAAGPLGPGYALAGASYGGGDGFVPIVERQRGPADRASRYDQANLRARIVAPLTGTTELQASGLWFRDERERGTLYSDIGTTGMDGSLRLVGSGAWRWSALAYVQTRSFYNSFASVDGERAVAARVAEQYEVPSTALGGRLELRPPLRRGLELRLGGDARLVSGETRERYNFQQGVGTRGRVAGGKAATWGAFAELGWQRGPWTVSGGGRIDRWEIRNGSLVERLFATGALLTDTHFPDRGGWEPTGRAGAAWNPSHRFGLRAAAYLGWRLPTLNELYRPFRVGPDATAANAGLDPERLEGIEAGIELKPHRAARIEATLFANRLEDAIANVTLGAGPGTFPGVGFVPAGGDYRQRRNLDAVEAVGIEIGGKLDLGRWTLRAGYSHVDSRVDASAAAAPLDGLRPAQTPREAFTAGIRWDGPRGIEASALLRRTGSQYEDDQNRQLLPAATTIDAAASIPVAHRLRLELRGENLLDAEVVTGISGAGIVERATPRTLWIGLRLEGAPGG